MSNDKNAQELLKWGLANSTSVASGGSIEQISSDISSGRRPDLSDPRLYDAIMGKSEAVMMREELTTATTPSLPLSDRITALDNFEMLIEQIDNANNITSMNMWQPIISLLGASEPEIQSAAAWIVGTAVQNNDKAQVAVLQYDTVRALVHLLQSGKEEVRRKGMYALSSLLKHNPMAMHQFVKIDGWKVLRDALIDPDINLRRKTAFLINALLLQDPNDFDSIPRSNSATTKSTATALAPTPDRTAPLAPGPAPAVPLETGPATQLTSIVHPNVARSLLTSGILTTLISSLLPPGHPAIQQDLAPPPCGPDGDTDGRTDLDFAEKATTAVLTLTCKLPPPTSTAFQEAIDTKKQSLFKALLSELQGMPLNPDQDAKTRWEQLGIDKQVFHHFHQNVSAW
ncbi:hypothetical protein NDA17_004089 [Ustilago hordei]|nr:hypothetical protein NDA17_004089 [Ustilago hordei]